MKSIRVLIKSPYINLAVPIDTCASFKPPTAPSARPTNGFIKSTTNALTKREMAPPKIKPTAKPTTPRSLIKFKNPFMFFNYTANWRCFLGEVRTFFDENPNSEF